jgi:hypothetical protein
MPHGPVVHPTGPGHADADQNRRHAGEFDGGFVAFGELVVSRSDIVPLLELVERFNDKSCMRCQIVVVPGAGVQQLRT